MKKTETPKWLINGAVNQWMGIRNLTFLALFLVLLESTPGAICMYTATFWKTGNVGLWGLMLAGIGVVFAVLGFLIARKIVMKKIGHSKKWQKKYLQSRIDEYTDYLEVAETNIKQAAANCKSTINAIKKNKAEMKEKANQAENYLIMNFN